LKVPEDGEEDEERDREDGGDESALLSAVGEPSRESLWRRHELAREKSKWRERRRRLRRGRTVGTIPAHTPTLANALALEVENPSAFTVRAL
jgi:hypothetical protein